MPTYFEGDIVIAGISGRLPESSNIEEFKENLMKGTDMVTEDERRWIPGLYDLPSRLGKLKNLHNFDASFFKIPPKQAHVMDPQLRIMLEVTYEALIDAGVNPSTLKKSRTGVFIGVSASDANDFWRRKPDGKYILRTSRTVKSVRIAFHEMLITNFKGRKITVCTKELIYSIMLAVNRNKIGLQLDKKLLTETEQNLFI